MTLPRVAFLALLFATGAAIFTAAPRASHDDATSQSAEASRLNNIGVAYMNQQLFEKALKNFEAASAQDPSLHIAKLNCGVALLNLQKIDDAGRFLETAPNKIPKTPTPGTTSACSTKTPTRPTRPPLPSSASLKSIPTTPTPGTSSAASTPSPSNIRRPFKPSNTRSS